MYYILSRTELARLVMGTIFLVIFHADPCNNSLASERSERDTLRTVQSRIGDMVRVISVYSAGVPYTARFTAAVKIRLP